MLKALLLFLTNLALAAMATAQNLVPNPSFEDTSNCQLPEGQYEFMLGLTRPWFSPTDATPDVYSMDPEAACGLDVVFEGLTEAYDGLRYAGVYMFINSLEPGGTKEYLALRLEQPLIQQQYTLSMRIARANFSRYAVDSFGVHFSSDSMHFSNIARLPLTPQVVFGTNGHFESMEWIEVSAVHTATGGERFMYIGSFEEDAQMDWTYDPFFGGADLGYYYVDRVELVSTDVGIVDRVGANGPMLRGQNVLIWEGVHSATVIISDASGKVVLGPLFFSGGHMQLPQQLSSGLYTLFVRDDFEGTVLKWVKE